MKIPGFAVLLLAFTAGSTLAQAPPAAWFLNAQGTGGDSVYFSVGGSAEVPPEDPREVLLGWSWIESGTHVERYPGSTPARYRPSRLSGQQPRQWITDGQRNGLPKLGIGPSRELWLLGDDEPSTASAMAWAEMLDSVEAAHRHSSPDLAEHQRHGVLEIGQLGRCVIRSIPAEGQAPGWSPLHLAGRARPSRAGGYYYVDPDEASRTRPVGSRSRESDIEVQRFLRLLEGPEDCGGHRLDLSLIPAPIEEAFYDPYFLVWSDVEPRPLSFLDLEPTPKAAAVRTLARGSGTAREQINLAGWPTAGREGIDLCSAPFMKTLCLKDRRIREQLATAAKTGTRVSDVLMQGCRDFFEAQGSAPSPHPCSDPGAWRQRVGAYRTGYTGDLVLRDQPRLVSRISDTDEIQWLWSPTQAPGRAIGFPLADGTRIELGLPRSAPPRDRPSSPPAATRLSSAPRPTASSTRPSNPPVLAAASETTSPTPTSTGRGPHSSPSPTRVSRPATEPTGAVLAETASAETAPDETVLAGTTSAETVSTSGAPAVTAPARIASDPTAVSNATNGPAAQANPTPRRRRGSNESSTSRTAPDPVAATNSGTPHRASSSSAVRPSANTSTSPDGPLGAASPAVFRGSPQAGVAAGSNGTSGPTVDPSTSLDASSPKTTTDPTAANAETAEPTPALERPKLASLASPALSFAPSWLAPLVLALLAMTASVALLLRRQRISAQNRRRALSSGLIAEEPAPELLLDEDDPRERLFAGRSAEPDSEELLLETPSPDLESDAELPILDPDPEPVSAVDEDVTEDETKTVPDLPDLQTSNGAPPLEVPALVASTTESESQEPETPPAEPEELSEDSEESEPLTLEPPALSRVPTATPDDSRDPAPSDETASARAQEAPLQDRSWPQDPSWQRLEQAWGELNAQEQEGLEHSLTAADRLGEWVDCLLPVLDGIERGDSGMPTLDHLPAPAQQEWREAHQVLRELADGDLVVLQQLWREISHPTPGSRLRADVGSPEMEYLRAAGLFRLNGTRIPDRLRQHLLQPGSGRLQHLVLALQYLIEAFPVEHLEKPERKAYLDAVRERLAAKGLPTQFHRWVEELATGLGLQYQPTRYYKARIDDPDQPYLANSHDTLDLSQRLGYPAGTEEKVVVRSSELFLFDAQSGNPFSGQAWIDGSPSS